MWTEFLVVLTFYRFSCPIHLKNLVGWVGSRTNPLQGPLSPRGLPQPTREHYERGAERFNSSNAPERWNWGRGTKQLFACNSFIFRFLVSSTIEKGT